MMKRSIANRIAALALALVLAGSLVPGAWAAEGEPEGGGQLTGVTVTPSNLSMKVGERASVRASAAGLSQDQMEEARIEWSLENNDRSGSGSPLVGTAGPWRWRQSTPPRPRRQTR